jgi:hypothetical protein
MCPIPSARANARTFSPDSITLGEEDFVVGRVLVDGGERG